MKKFHLLKLCCLLLGAVVIVRCSSEEATLNITSINLEVDQETILLGQSVKMSATNQDGIDITNEVTYTVNNIEIDGNVHTPPNPGNFAVRASYQSITSKTVNITVIQEISSITLSATQTSITPNGMDETTFIVVNQDGADITGQAELFMDNEPFESKDFSSDEFGSYVFEARFESLISNSLTIVAELTISGLTLTADRTSIPANGGTSPVFRVVDQEGDVVTDFVSIYYGEDVLVDHKFTISTIGSYDLVAKYEDVTSDPLTINAVAQRTNRKILIEEFTGEWCGWCPQAAYNLDLLVKSNSKVLTVGIHNGDPFEYSNEETIRDAFGLNYFPSGLVGRVNLGMNVGYNGVTLSSQVTDEIDRQLNNEEVLAGISINTTLSGNNALVDVDVEFYRDMDEQTGLTIYLIENDVIGDIQANYFADYAPYIGTYYYSQPPNIPEYVHQYMLRKAATDVQGEDIPVAQAKGDNTYSFSQKSIDITGYDASKCFIIAFIHYRLDGEKQTIINAQQVKLGENIGFEE